MKHFVVVFFVLLIVQLSNSKTLIVSDVDDTIKVAHVLYKTDALLRATDATTPFVGMAQLYEAIIQQAPSQTKMVYLSNAPELVLDSPIMRQSHERFLAANHFPVGDLILRDQLPVSSHKLTKIRELILNEKPDQVILFSDNGESDADVYHQITIENAANSIHFVTFIRLLYSSHASILSSEKGHVLFPEQVGFVTPVEISLELQKQKLLDEASVQWMMTHVGNYIVNETRYQSDKGRSVGFARFENCQDFKWSWDVTPELQPLVSKIKQRCN